MLLTLQTRKNKWSTTVIVAATAVICLTLSTGAFAAGISAEQGDAILAELRQIRVLLEKQKKQAQDPSAPAAQTDRVSAKLAPGDYQMGSASAPLVLIEYTDYQCPFCAKFDAGTLPEIKKNFIDTGKVRYVSRDLPLDFHKDALKAAQAVRCAGDQGKYWEMREKVVGNQGRVDSAELLRIARVLPLKVAEYQSCLDSGRNLDDIRKGVQTANSLGISGTPSFVLGRVVGDSVDGLRIVGAQPYATFESRINDLLQNAAKR